MRGYLPFIQKDAVTHMHELAVYVKEDLLFAQDLSMFYLRIYLFIYVFGWLYFIRGLTSFSSVDRLLHLSARFLMLFHVT